MNSKAGILFIVATPIGNLGDISSRALEVLSEVKLCAAEDTRKTKILFDKYGIKTRLTSYHKFSERQKLDTLLNFLQEGNSLALVSDAGTPIISDPGLLLVQEAINLDINISPLPGASSVIAALSVSGFPGDQFSFLGFPPRKGKERVNFINSLMINQSTSIIFESGPRLKRFLEQILEIDRNKNVCVSREVTKLYETFYRGKVADVIYEIENSQFGTKGEFVVLIEAFTPLKKEGLSEEERRIFNLILEDLPNNDAMVLASKILDINKNKLYDIFIEEKK